MANLREIIESDLSQTLEGEYAVAVELKSTAGVAETVRGAVFYDYVKQNAATGEQITVNEPIVILRISSLRAVPRAGEVWHLRFPVSPVAGAPLAAFVLSPTHPPELGGSIGFVRLFPQRVKQT